MKFDTVDGFVAAKVQIAGTAAGLPVRRVGQGDKAAVLARSHQVHFGRVFARFFVGFLAPAAGDDKVHRGRARQVHRHDGVFSQPPALHEQNFELRGHCQQLAQIGFGLLADRDEFFAAVAHFHHAHAAAVPVEHLGCSLL